MPNTEPLDEEQLANSKVEKATTWLGKILAREKDFTEGWWKRAEAASELFDNGKKGRAAPRPDEIPYNILYSNTEVLLPSLYSATPKPDIRSRFKGVELKPLPQVIERFLTIAADSASPGGESFDCAMLDCVLSALVPGMGYIRIKYIKDRSFPLIPESGHFKTLIWAKANRWSKVPWIAFKHAMRKEQMFSQFEIEDVDKVHFQPDPDADDETRDSCIIYELWDKVNKKVYFLSEQWGPRELKETDDPLGLENFFPTPGPLLLTMKPGKLEPTPLYDYYRNQAEELNRVTVRLNKVLSAIRVRGAYNSLMGEDLKKLLSADELENELVAASEAALLAQSGGFDKHIWLLPIERFITVAQELYRARESIKQVIYEITGISDIIRGSSQASETATAQDLKNKWGTVRLRKMQTTVANYARDLFRMIVDCGSTSVSAEKWKEIVQLPIPTEKEQSVARQQIMYLQQTMQMQPQVPGQPPPPPPDPALLAAAQGPTMEQILEKISSDMSRTFVINIQTSSTVDLDTAQDKAEVGEFMNAMGQLMSGLGPLTTLGPSGLQAAKQILIAVCQRYKFGLDIVPSLEAIEPPPPQPPEPAPPGPSPEEQEVIKAESALKLQEIQAKTQILQAETAFRLAEIQAKQEKLSIDIQAAQLKLAAAQARPIAPRRQNAAV